MGNSTPCHENGEFQGALCGIRWWEVRVVQGALKVSVVADAYEGYCEVCS